MINYSSQSKQSMMRLSIDKPFDHSSLFLLSKQSNIEKSERRLSQNSYQIASNYGTAQKENALYQYLELSNKEEQGKTDRLKHTATSHSHNRTNSDFRGKASYQKEEQKYKNERYEKEGTVGRLKMPENKQKMGSILEKSILEQKQQNTKYQECFQHASSVGRLENYQKIKYDPNFQSLNAQIVKMNERLMKTQQKIQKLQKSSSNGDNINFNALKSQKYPDFNEILDLIDEIKQQQVRSKEQYQQLNEQCHSIMLNFKNELNKTCKKRELDDLSQAFWQKIEMQDLKIAQRLQFLRKNIENDLSSKFSSFLNLQQHSNYENQRTFKSNKPFEGRMISFTYEQRIIRENSNTSQSYSSKYRNQTQQALLSSKTYYIDSCGYLLDKNKYYLLDENGLMIRLSAKEIYILKNHNILL